MEIKDNVLIKIEDTDLFDDTLILDDVIEIGESVFENNKFVKKIEAPNLKKVHTKAFYNCQNLIEFKAPLLEYVADFAFALTSLTDFDFASILEIGKNSFERTNLNTVILPKNLKKLGKYAFSNNEYLVRVNILSLMTKIKDNMFENCINLKEVTLSNTINKMGTNVFKNCKKLPQIILPEHLKIIELNCFWGCENLKRIEFNNELEVLGDYAFGDTKINSIVLPGTIKSIGKLPFHMCYQLEHLKVPKLFHDEIIDKTNSKLKDLIIGSEKIEILKPIRKVINYSNLVIVKYNDDSFQVLSKPVKYYDQEYFNKMFKSCNVKLLLKNDFIYNIFYWESILSKNELEELNPIAFIALPPNINMIKAFSKKHYIYDEIIENNGITDFNNAIAVFKFITIFGGLCKKNVYNINNLIAKIGIRNLTKQFFDTNVKEFNQKFINLYLKLSENYSFKEINNVMPFLYNRIEKVINLENNTLLDTIEEAKFSNENTTTELEFEILDSNQKYLNYEWLDTTSIENLLRGYILGSVNDYSIDSNEQVRKVLTYNIKDEKGLVVATSRAYYSVEEKYLLFNSIILTQSFINKNYTVDTIKSLIIDYVLEAIQDTLNFLNEFETIVEKVHVGISEKSIKEQIQNNGTKIISQNI